MFKDIVYIHIRNGRSGAEGIRQTSEGIRIRQTCGRTNSSNKRNDMRRKRRRQKSQKIRPKRPKTDPHPSKKKSLSLAGPARRAYIVPPHSNYLIKNITFVIHLLKL